MIEKFKSLNKSQKILIFVGLGLFVVAFIVLMISWALAGWDIGACFTGKTAIAIYILVGVYVMVAAIILIKDKLKV